MVRFKEYPSQDAIKKLLSYDAETGVFTWLARQNANWSARWSGAVAGSIDTRGHRQIKLDGALFAAHRLAWIYEFGATPDAEIDHKNGIKDDNRIANLRQATHSQNQQNIPCKKTNRLGMKGVSFRPGFGKFVAKIQLNKKSTHLGCFDTAEQASAAYATAAAQLHAEFARS